MPQQEIPFKQNTAVSISIPRAEGNYPERYYYEYKSAETGELINGLYEPIGKIWGLNKFGIRANIRKLLGIDVACCVVHDQDEIRVFFILNNAFEKETATEKFQQTTPAILNLFVKVLAEFLKNPNGHEACKNFFAKASGSNEKIAKGANKVFRKFLQSDKEIKRLFEVLRDYEPKK